MSRCEYQVTAPRAGGYSLTARVVTPKHSQRLNVAANDGAATAVMEMPFTIGTWQDCEPVTLALKAGENTLRFWRDDPPQSGLAIKSFSLKPLL